MQRFSHRRAILSTAVATVVFAGTSAHAVPGYTGGTYAQNFDSLVNTPTNTALAPASQWFDDTTLPGWFYVQTLNTDNEGGYQRLRASSGNSNTGSLYSFGPNGNTDRALGFIDSNTLAAVGQVGQWLALRLRNDTADTTYTSFTLKYNGEQWRDGGAATPNAQKIEFSYGLDAVGLKGPGYTRVSTLDFTSPVLANTTSGAAVDGNVAGRVSINADGSVVVSGINWEPGQDLWLRWTDINDAGNDHGLAIDDLNFSAGGAVTGTPASRTWNAATGSGNWSDASKWLNNNVGGSGALARVSSAMSGPTSINLDVSPTVAGLVVNASTHDFTLTASAGQQLNVAAGGTVSVSNSRFVQTTDTSSRAAPLNQTQSVPAGAHTIAAPLNFAGAGTIAVGDLATLSLTGSITVAAGGGLTKTGAGTLVLTAPSNYSGPTTISGGLISFSNSNQLGDDSPTNTLIIQNGGGIMPTADLNMTRPLSFDTGGFTVRTDSNATLGPVAGPGMFNKVLAGTVTVASLRTAGAYVAAADRTETANAGVLRIAPNGTDAATSVVNFLRIESTTASSGALLGQLDVSDNAFIIDYTLTGSEKSPLGGAIEAGAPFPRMNGLDSTRVAVALWSAYAGGRWTGKGITSARAQTTGGDEVPVSVYSVGYAEASRLLGLTGAQTATFAGQTVDATSILIRGTFGGDANLDGTINADDYALTDRGFNLDLQNNNTTPRNTANDQGQFSQWQDGDFNYDTVVNAADYLILDRSFLFLHPAAADPAFLADRQARFGDDYVAALLASVPEPSALSLLSLTAIPALRRRRPAAR